MSMILPDGKYSRATRITVVVPVSTKPDLYDPGCRVTVIPSRVALNLYRNEGTEKGRREYAQVSVSGPRRLKSGEAGKEIITNGWESSVNMSWRGSSVERPDWLTLTLAENIPHGWDPSLLGLTVKAQ